LQITGTKELEPRVVESISKILGCSYEKAKLHTVSISKGQWSENLPELTRTGANYSEPHMGAGEQKVVRLVVSLENLPDKSLVLLEEPEITLHPDAQRGLAWYLMTLSRNQWC
jgi:predicted ATPase